MSIKKTIILLFFSISFHQLLWSVEGRPKLRMACLNNSDSIVTLLWNKPSDNCSSFTSFSLYGRDNSLSIYSFLRTYNSFSLDNISFKVGNLKNWEFYIVYNKACNGIDSIYSDTIIIDRTRPVLMDIDSVSIDLVSQKSIIGWSKNPSKDTKGYIVYHVTSTNTNIKDTNSTYYEDKGSRNPTVSSIRYSIAAYDSCDNLSAISNSHSTMFLNQVYNACNKTIQLNWNNYVGWQVSNYAIFRKINTGNFELVGTVVSNINQFTYNFSNFGDQYCFYIRAFKQGSSISSSSNIVCVNTNSITETNNSYIAKASVQNGAVELTLITESGKSLEKINIYKSEDNNNFNLWQTLNFTGGVIELIDNNVTTNSKSYSYFFSTIGPCNLIFDSSQVAKTILLDATLIDLNNQLIGWNLYNDFIKKTEKQEILLSNNENYNKSSPWNILNSLNNVSTNYQDKSTFSITQQKLCYCVRAIENNPNINYNRKDTSYSNIVCLNADPIIYFPNAIQLNGYNNVFKPQGVFINEEESSIQIFNRWGELIHESKNLKEHWDGRGFDGEFVQEDVYIYKSIVKGQNGKILIFDGTITVLK